MRLLLLGATGRTGKMLVKEALKKGFKLNCLVRNSDNVNIKNDDLKVFEGSPESISDLKKAVHECDIIISVLNISRKSDFPWAKLRTPKTFLSTVMSSIIQIAEEHSIKRVITCSAWGVFETKNDLPKWFNWFIENSNIGVAYRDHERQEELLKKSNIPWTIVRPSGLINLKKEQKIIESYKNLPRPKLTISRLSVAKYIINSLEHDQLIGKTPVISGN